jgi:predicted O-methyltransferase YrrM
MAVPESERGPSKPEEFLALWRQMEELLKEMRRGVERDWHRAQDAVADLIRTQTATGMAPTFFTRKRPWEANELLTAMIENGILDHAAFPQKMPHVLAFYRRLLTSLDREPASILEIGVKGGGSTAVWKRLFPNASVVGIDIKLRRWLTREPSEDGVVYLQGDQTDTARLDEIAAKHGPFDLVIDDGSHVSDHVAGTLRLLLPHVRAGGIYVIEDTHSSVRKPGAWRSNEQYGEDIWPDFTLAVFERLRRGATPPSSAGAKLASAVSGMIADLIVSTQVMAIRKAEATELASPA